jgi:toxic protein SymE
MTAKDKRELKVCSSSGYHYKPTPTIILKGQWLQQFGFEIGDQLRVSCENGKLIIANATTNYFAGMNEEK